MDDLVRQVSKRIKDLRNASNISQDTLGKMVNLSQQAINKYENKTAPDIQTLKNICDIFGINLSEFFSEIEQCSELSPDEMQIIQMVRKLSPNQLKILKEVIRVWIQNI